VSRDPLRALAALASFAITLAVALTASPAAEAASCNNGSLSLTAPSSVTFPSLTLNGKDQNATANATLTPNDQTGSGSGWKITVYATAWTDGHGNTLAAPQATAASASAASGNCSLPTNTVTYPTASFGTTSATATKIYNAAVGTGKGPTNLTLTFSLPIPAKQTMFGASDSFTSTWTFTIASGP
jgi:hypothetical protein